MVTDIDGWFFDSMSSLDDVLCSSTGVLGDLILDFSVSSPGNVYQFSYRCSVAARSADRLGSSFVSLPDFLGQVYSLVNNSLCNVVSTKSWASVLPVPWSVVVNGSIFASFLYFFFLTVPIVITKGLCLCRWSDVSITSS